MLPVLFRNNPHTRVHSLRGVWFVADRASSKTSQPVAKTSFINYFCIVLISHFTTRPIRANFRVS